MEPNTGQIPNFLVLVYASVDQLQHLTAWCITCTVKLEHFLSPIGHGLVTQATFKYY